MTEQAPGGPPPAGNPPAGGTPPSGAGGGAPPAAFSWGSDLDAPVVDLLKSKGMYDDPNKGANALARSYYEANKALSGGDVIITPGNWDDQVQVDKYLAKVRPATTDAYTPKFGEGVEVHPPLVEFSKKLAHTWGVPPALFQKGIDAWQDFAKEQNAMATTAAAKANDDAINGMKTKMGAQQFDAAVANSQAVYKSLAAKGAISRETLVALDANIGSAALLELMAAIGANMKGEAPVLGNGSTGGLPTDPTQMTPEQAATEISRLQGDGEFQKKYTDAKHPEHKVAVERIKMLFEARVRKPA